MTRFDAVNYISHGIAKRPGMSEPRAVRGVDEDAATVEAGEEKKRAGDALEVYCVNLNEKARDGRIDPLIGREPGDRAHHPGSVPAAEEQPAVRRRSRRRQDRHRRRPGAQDRHGRGAGGAGQRDHLPARHGRAARRHPLSRRFRGAAEGGDARDRGLSRRDHVHRRDPHGDRRRRHLRRRDGRLQPAEAGARIGHAALHRLDHLQGVPPAFREGPRAGAALPEDRRARADRAGRGRDPEGAEALFRGLPQGPLHQRGDQGGGRAVGQVHPRPQAAGQGDRRDRRDRRLADAAARARSGKKTIGVKEVEATVATMARIPPKTVSKSRHRGAAQPRRGPEAGGVRPGQGDRGARLGDQAGARRPARAGQADRLLPVLRPDRRRQDRGRAPARASFWASSCCASTCANIWSATPSRG